MSKLLQEKAIVVVKGKLLGGKGKGKLAVEEIYSIEEAKKKFPPFLGSLHLQVSQVALDDELSDKIIEIIMKHPGQSKVYLDVKDYQNGDYTIETEYSVKYDDSCIDELEKLIGEGNAVLQYKDKI